MAVKTCPKCGESNSSSAMVCIVCSGSLKDVKPEGASEEEKRYAGVLNAARKSRRVCEHCHEENEPGALKCRYCGSTISRAPASQGSYRYAGSGGEGGPSGCAVVLLFVATFFIPLVGLIVGGIFSFNDDPDKSAVGKALLIFGLIMIAVGFFIFF